MKTESLASFKSDNHICSCFCCCFFPDHLCLFRKTVHQPRGVYIELLHCHGSLGAICEWLEVCITQAAAAACCLVRRYPIEKDEILPTDRDLKCKVSQVCFPTCEMKGRRTQGSRALYQQTYCLCTHKSIKMKYPLVKKGGVIEWIYWVTLEELPYRSFSICRQHSRCQSQSICGKHLILLTKKLNLFRLAFRFGSQCRPERYGAFVTLSIFPLPSINLSCHTWITGRHWVECHIMPWMWY